MSKGYTIIVAGIVPPHLERRLSRGGLIPRTLVLEAVGAEGVIAGSPEMIPVRPLGPEDVVAAMGRALEQGQVSPVVAFQVVPVGHRPTLKPDLQVRQ